MPLKKKQVIIVGSTGSVGSSAIDFITLNKDYFEVLCLVAFNNITKLFQQAHQVNAKEVIIIDESCYDDLKNLCFNTNIKVSTGENYLIDLLNQHHEGVILICSSGTDSIRYIYSALKHANIIALANKESIVCGGSLLQGYVKKYGSTIIPVDSEHSAIFQSIQNASYKDISSVVLTASGGPFIDTPLSEFKNITKAQALKHPTWQMGPKISIDSATLMNKSLELIEACYLFNIHPSQVDVVIHRQSIMHGGVNFVDGSFIGHFSYPSMAIPVGYALSFPERRGTNIKALNFLELKNLNFEAVDNNKFRSLNLARNCVITGGNSPLIFNIANEVAVEYFLKNKISFIKILDVIEYTLDSIKNIPTISFEDIIEECRIVKKFVNNYIEGII